MCGFVGHVASIGADVDRLTRGLASIEHRGPDDHGVWSSPSCALGFRRLSILDLSIAGHQPMASPDGRYQIVLNGEIYNYLELRSELGGDAAFTTGTDTEVLLAAYARWGQACLHKLRGMFAFAIWDTRDRTLFCARDRFGVKPMFFHEASGQLWFASEIKALHAAGVARTPDVATWATYLSAGLYDHTSATFWGGIRSLLPGHVLTWSESTGATTARWYDVAAEVGRLGPDLRDDAAVADELLAILDETVRLRFRADVPVGLCLSGGLDSSLLLALTQRLKGKAAPVKTFTFITGDPAYDETPWVEQMLATGEQQAFFCQLHVEDVPELAAQVQRSQDEPFGGFPTLAMSRVHERARAEGVTVLLDGNGVDEAWAGYDYYARAESTDWSRGPVQASTATLAARTASCLLPKFAALAQPFNPARPFGDPLADLQLRDLTVAKIPRAMRFADRVSMMFSRELREPFLDHRFVELGLRQPAARKIRDGQGKWLVRRVAERLLPASVGEAPKRPVQTPQREWLRGPLAAWSEAQIERALAGWGSDWLDADATRAAWRHYRDVGGDNSFPIWQWISLGLLTA